MSVVVWTVAPAAAGCGLAATPSTSAVPRTRASLRRGALWLRDARPHRPGKSRGEARPPVKVVRPVGRSTLTGGHAPPTPAHGSTADGMSTRAVTGTRRCNMGSADSMACVPVSNSLARLLA